MMFVNYKCLLFYAYKLSCQLCSCNFLICKFIFFGDNDKGGATYSENLHSTDHIVPYAEKIFDSVEDAWNCWVKYGKEVDLALKRKRATKVKKTAFWLMWNMCAAKKVVGKMTVGEWTAVIGGRQERDVRRD